MTEKTNDVPKVTAAKGKAAPKVPDGHLRVRITKIGHEKVFDGEGGTFDWKDEPTFPEATARALEARGYVETDEAP